MEQRNVAIYARVSTDDQDAARQVHDLAQWADRMGWHRCLVAVETASGADNSRATRRKLISIAKQPKLANLLKDEKQLTDLLLTYTGGSRLDEKIDAILVTELSRWSRSTVDLVATLDDLAAHGVSLLTLQGLCLDMSSPTGRLTAHIIGAVAEFERGLLSERTKSGLAHAKAKGVILGRPTGSKSDHWKRYRGVIALHTDNQSLHSISKMTGVPRSTIKRMIDHHKANNRS